MSGGRAGIPSGRATQIFTVRSGWTIVRHDARATALAMFLPASNPTGQAFARAVRCCPVFAAFVAAIGLLMIAFAAVAAFRVAQESRFASLQSDLARRG